MSMDPFAAAFDRRLKNTAAGEWRKGKSAKWKSPNQKPEFLDEDDSLNFAQSSNGTSRSTTGQDSNDGIFASDSPSRFELDVSDIAPPFGQDRALPWTTDDRPPFGVYNPLPYAPLGENGAMQQRYLDPAGDQDFQLPADVEGSTQLSQAGLPKWLLISGGVCILLILLAVTVGATLAIVKMLKKQRAASKRHRAPSPSSSAPIEQD